jgi:hypothetical protein
MTEKLEIGWRPSCSRDTGGHKPAGAIWRDVFQIACAVENAAGAQPRGPARQFKPVWVLEEGAVTTAIMVLLPAPTVQEKPDYPSGSAQHFPAT